MPYQLKHDPFNMIILVNIMLSGVIWLHSPLTFLFMIHFTKT